MNPSDELKAPAIALALSGLAGFLFHCLLSVGSIFGIVIGLQGRGSDEDLIPMFAAIFVLTLVTMACGLFIAFGGWSLRKGPTLVAKIAAIIAVIPCLNPLGMLGLPFGIWALVAMNKVGSAPPSPQYG